MFGIDTLQVSIANIRRICLTANLSLMVVVVEVVVVVVLLLPLLFSLLLVGKLRQLKACTCYCPLLISRT